MRPRAARRALLAAWVLLPLLLMSGVASAHWGASGSGTGTAVAGRTDPLTLGTGAPSAGLFPGGHVDLTVVASNAGGAPVRVGSLVLDESAGDRGFGVDPDHAACDLSVLTFTPSSPGGSGWTVPARVGTVDGIATLVLTGALGMGADAANACQGAQLTVFVRVGPAPTVTAGS